MTISWLKYKELLDELVKTKIQLKNRLVIVSEFSKIVNL